MNIFGKLFGGRKKRPKVLLHEAIKKLRITEDLLIKRQAFLEQKIRLEIVNARKYGTKNKSLALYALKRKKQYEKQLNQIDGTLSTIEFQREALENASTNSEVLNAMSSAAIALKTAHKHTNVNQVYLVKCFAMVSY
jgi:charged multivesicular body protein 4